MNFTYTRLFLIFCCLAGSVAAKAQQWSIVSSSGSASSPVYMDVTYSASNIWHLCGTGGTLKLSDNYGQTWVNANTGINSSTVQLNTIEFSTSQIGFAGGITTTLPIGNYGMLYFTVDGGHTWTDYNAGSSLQGVNAIHFPSLYRGYAVAGNRVLRTTSGGDSWHFNYTYGSIDLYDIYFPDSLVGFACGELGSIIRTKDGGGSWQTVYYGPFDDNFYSIWFVNKNVGFACGENGQLVRTTNGGDDWTEYNTSTSTDFNSITFFNSSEGFIVGQGGYILYTDNGGNNFSYVTSPTTMMLTKVAMSASNQAIAVGMRETILKFGSLGVGAEEIVPLDAAHMRIYPNPASTQITVQVGQNSETATIINIFDMAGKLVYSQTHQFADREATVPTETLESGVYALQVQTGTNFYTQQFIKQ